MLVFLFLFYIQEYLVFQILFLYNFINYYSIIFTRSTNVKINNDENYIRTIFEKLDIPEYKKETKILTREEELKKISNLKTFLYNFD